MKTLKKVRIINWHYFYNVTFDLAQVNFLTGQNASGKSTLIDAMQVVLLGDTTGRQFNKAASDKSGRTLKGYLKGELGDDGEGSVRYLRNGRFSSYIVLEWYDDLLDKSFCTGIVFDVYEDSTEEHHFFILKDKIPENDFCLLQVPMSYKQLSDYFQMNYHPTEFWFAETNIQYRERIKEEFGGIKDKYFSLFKKAVSFIPISNIEQFLTEYVCDVPSEINIDSMRNNIQQYKRLEIEADNMKQKICKLEEIQRCYKEYLNYKQDLDVSNYITKRVSYQLVLNQIGIFQRDVNSCESRLEEIEKEISSIDLELSNKNKTKEGLIAHKVSSGSYQLTTELQNARDASAKKITNIEESLEKIKNNFSMYISSYENASKNILALVNAVEGKRIFNQYKKDFERLIETSKNIGISVENFKKIFHDENEINAESLVNFKDAMYEFKKDVSDVFVTFKSVLSTMIQAQNIAKQQILDMERGGKMYDYNLTSIRDELKHKLSDYYGKEVSVLIYADLVDIKTPRWVNAIEGFISNQKLNMFVDNEYYETANKILPQIMKNKGYYRTGLVDAEKLHNARFVQEENSLAEEIVTEHQGARDYSNFLLGRLKKCESFKEARESGNGITPSCDGYRAFASFTLPARSYQYPLIGRRVSKEVLRVKELEVQENGAVIEVLRALVDALNKANNLEIISSYEVDNAKLILEDCETLPGLRMNLDRYEAELANSGSLEISSIDSKIAKLDSDIKNLEQDKQNLILEKGKISQDIHQIQDEKIPHEIEKSNSILDEIKMSFDDEFINNIGFKKYEEELNSGKSLIAIRQEYESSFLRLQNRIRSQFNAMNELRREYCLAYKLSYDITKDSNVEFDNELSILRDVKLPEYQAKISDAYAKATKEFKDDFIYKLKTSIESVRTQIDELNEALKDSQFGQDSYQFVMTPAPQYKDYYNMITDNLLLTSTGEGENNEYFTKYQEVMNSLFKLIGDVSSSKDQNSVLEQNVVKFTDYRTYLSFDMMVKKGDAKPVSLARNILKQSGGETQTPFYVSILASFSQLYRVRQIGTLGNCIRLVIFDEAFSKMDVTRIVESVKILKNFGLQVILSAPSDKVSDIAKVVDKTLLVNKQNGRSFVDLFEIKK